MTAIPQPFSAREASPRLTDPLHQVARRQWSLNLWSGVLQTVVVASIAFLIATLFMGLFQSLWVSVRIVLSLIVWAVVIRAGIRFLRPALQRWSLSHAAQHVEQNSPDLHERLSSAVELAGESNPVFRGSAGLVAHLFKQAESDAEAIQPDQVISSNRLFRWAIFSALMTLVWLAAVITPATRYATLAGFYHTLMPWKTTLPALLTQVAVSPGDVVLIQGNPLEITAHLSFDRPSADNSRRATLVRKYEGGVQSSDIMEQTGPHDFRFNLSDVQQSFTYKVSTQLGDSTSFKAVVHPRPQITSLEVRCDFPAYSGIAATVVNSPDGNIRALVGTHVTLNIGTALPISLDKSGVLMQTGLAEDELLPMKQLQPGVSSYQVQFTVSRSGDYRINLTNDFTLTNKDEQPRSIVALPDEAPRIIIRAPEPHTRVGEDDSVPVKFTATDDFGISRIEALIQIDSQPAQTINVKFEDTNKRVVTRPPFVLSVADLLKSAGAGRVQTITYQLKATDNRDPDPQFAFSNKQVLTIDHNDAKNFAAHEDQKRGQELQRAIEHAIGQLNEAQQRVQQARDVEAKQPLEDWRKKQLHDAAEALPKTSKELAQAAEDARDTSLADVAKKVQAIATNPIESAAEDAVRADLNSDKGQDRKEAARRAVEEITQARDALQKLQQDQAIDKAERQAEAARDLNEAAEKQQEAADLMKAREQQQANAQDKPDQARQQQEQRQAQRDQEQASQKLQQALQQSEALRDQQAQATAQQLQNLIRKVDDLQKEQDTTAQATKKQQDLAGVQQKANEIAQKQEALNQDIQKAADENKDALQKANANPVNKDQQQNIIKSLDQNNLQQAHDQMQQAANQLHQEARQLEAQAKTNELHPDAKEQGEINQDQLAHDEADKQKAAAQQAANDLNKAADELKQQPAAPPDPSRNDGAKQDASEPNAAPKTDDHAVEQAKQTAKEIENKASEMHPQDAEAKQKADTAKADAQAAEKAADQAQHAATADEAKHDLKEAAKDLNQSGQELAEAQKKNTDARMAEMVKAQQQAEQAAADQAEKQAKQQEVLANAVNQPRAALAMVKDPPQAGQMAQQQNRIAEQAKEAHQQAEQLQQQAEHADDADVKARAKQAAADLTDAQQHTAEAAQAQKQAAEAQHQAANADNAEQAKAAGEAAEKALQQAAANQQQAKADLAKAEAELRNDPQQPANVDAQQPADAKQNSEANAQPTADANGQQQGDLQAQANAQQAAANAQQTQANAKAAQKQAARSAQEANQAQQEASQRQNAEAAQQAARALKQAANQMAQATPGMQPGQPNEGQQPGDKPGKVASNKPSHSAESSQGLKEGSTPISVPGSVLDIGITADQWALLPPLAKKDLMNAAQQSGPPGYRQMTKDYYAKIAKLQEITGQ